MMEALQDQGSIALSKLMKFTFKGRLNEDQSRICVVTIINPAYR